ncbi:MAG: hypothetical protein KatS3mg040_0016 [Candidatus Kapaibacterium sp.]|nr:MAG: hypothetical protein KatS3mg040_0016 [Candidatus Kapabacteria bacterium]
MVFDVPDVEQFGKPEAYFVTICTQGRACLFGQVVEGQMRLNEAGHIAQQCWTDIPNHFPHVQLDVFIIMPNHVHGILVITENVDNVGATHASPLPNTAPPLPHGPRPGSIGAIIGSFKSAATRHINILRGTPGAPIWQRNYYEHVIRTEDALHCIRQYIVTNPLRWHLDRENPDRTGRNPDEEMWFGTI